MARKGKYEEWLSDGKLLQIEAWAKDGLTNEDIANNIGISTVTLYDWCNKFPSFLNALKKGKEVADIIVENALYKRAIGYSYEETVTEITKEPYIKKDGTVGEREHKHIKKITKTALPDVTAQIFWLKNRKPEAWREKQEHVVQNVEDLTPLAELLNADD